MGDDDGGFGMGVNSKGFDPRTVSASSFRGPPHAGAPRAGSGDAPVSSFGAPRAGAGSSLGPAHTVAMNRAEAEVLRREAAESYELTRSIQGYYDHLIEQNEAGFKTELTRRIAAIGAFPEMPVSTVLSLTPEQIEARDITDILQNIGNIYDDVPSGSYTEDLPVMGGGGNQRGGVRTDAEIETLVLNQAIDVSNPHISDELGTAYLDAQGTLNGLKESIIAIKVEQAAQAAIKPVIDSSAFSPRDKQLINERLEEQQKKNKRKFRQEVLVAQNMAASRPKRRIVAEGEARAAARAAADAAAAVERRRAAEAKVANAREAAATKAELQSLTNKKIDDVMNMLSSDAIKRQYEVGQGASSREAEGARGALGQISDTNYALTQLYVAKDRFTRPFRCYICGTQIPNPEDAQFEHVQDLFSSLSKKEVPIPGQSEIEKRIQRCLGEWACPYCNGTAKSNIDLTTNNDNGDAGLARNGWDDHMVYQASEPKIRTMLVEIYDHYQGTSKLRMYPSKAAFIAARLPIVKARVNMSCVITKSFVDWEKYQVAKKFIRYAIEEWIHAGKPTGGGGGNMLVLLMTGFFNSTYNPLKSDVADARFAFMDQPVMYFNNPGEPRNQSVDPGELHPAPLEATHGGQIMLALGIPLAGLMAGGRRKKNKKRFTMMAKRKAKRSTRRQARNRRS